MKIIDISWPISQEITGYKNEKDVLFEQIKHFEFDNARKTRIILSAHAGTHVDGPSHFLEHGKTIDQVSLYNLIGKAIVLDLSNTNNLIQKQDLEKFELKPEQIILLKTKNSDLPDNANFNLNFVYLSSDAAEYLAQIKIKAVGIDYLSIERDQANHDTHKILFANNITIIEGLRLSKVKSGSYFFICLPISIIGLEAAPARAILLNNLFK